MSILTPSATSMTRRRDSLSAHTPPTSRNATSGSEPEASTTPRPEARFRVRLLEHRERQRHGEQTVAEQRDDLTRKEKPELPVVKRAHPASLGAGSAPGP